MAARKIVRRSCLGARPRYNLVVDEDVKKPNKQNYGYDVHVIQGVLGEVEVSSYWDVSIITDVKSVVCESLSKCL